jgi:competence protein ComEA
MTGAAEGPGILLNKISISEMWKPYERFIVFHELREICYRAVGLDRDEAHEKARQNERSLWNHDHL